jgi:hypothetical protein
VLGRWAAVRPSIAAVLVCLLPACAHVSPEPPRTTAEPVLLSRPARPGSGTTAAPREPPPATVPTAEAAPAPAEPEPPPGPPWILERREALPGYAVARARLSTNQVVQINSGCGEWQTYTEGLLVQPDGGVLARFTAGPFVEIPGFLIVEQHLQVGSDGDDAPVRTPKGAQATIAGSNGAIWVTRVVAIDLATGELRDPPGWDSFAPVAIEGEDGLPAGLVVFARGSEPLAYTDPSTRRADSLHLWDVAAGATTKLAKLDGPVEIVSLDGRVYAKLGERALEISHEGATRELASERVPGDSPTVIGLPATSIGESPPAQWRDSEGRPIRVEDHGRTRPPSVGQCGVEGVFRIGDAILVDDGLYVWPTSLGGWPTRE